MVQVSGRTSPISLLLPHLLSDPLSLPHHPLRNSPHLCHPPEPYLPPCVAVFLFMKHVYDLFPQLAFEALRPRVNHPMSVHSTHYGINFPKASLPYVPPLFRNVRGSCLNVAARSNISHRISVILTTTIVAYVSSSQGQAPPHVVHLPSHLHSNPKKQVLLLPTPLYRSGSEDSER